MDDIFGEMNFTIPEQEDFPNERSTFKSILIAVEILSSICLTLHLIAFMIIPELRKHFGKYMSSLGVAILTNYLLVILANFILPGTDPSSCSYIIWMLFYFQLVLHLWIVIIGFEILQILSESLTITTFTSRKVCNRFVHCSLMAWLMPGLVVGSMLLIDLLSLQYLFPCFDPESVDYYCWLYHGCNHISIHRWPILFFILVGILVLILSGILILTCEKSKAETLATLSQQIQIKPFVVFVLLMDATIVLDLLMTDLNFHYAHIFSNTLGIVFFIGFTCTGIARIAVIKYLSKGRGSASENKPIDLQNYNLLSQPSDVAELEMM